MLDSLVVQGFKAPSLNPKTDVRIQSYCATMGPSMGT